LPNNHLATREVAFRGRKTTPARQLHALAPEIALPACRISKQRGKYDWDSGLASVARKLKVYQSYAIKSQNLDSEKDATFAGVLTGPTSQAHFDVLLVKQQSGQWAVGTFGGPDRK